MLILVRPIVKLNLPRLVLSRIAWKCIGIKINKEKKLEPNRFWVWLNDLFQKININTSDSLYIFQFFTVMIAFEPMYRKVNFKFMTNRRGGMNLAYNGFMYTAERKYKTTTNWVCNKNSNTTLRCPARCVTSNDTIKLSRKEHNHDPVYG